jgi:phage repressor protein C with HTH and peptisase S24 domain
MAPIKAPLYAGIKRRLLPTDERHVHSSGMLDSDQERIELAERLRREIEALPMTKVELAERLDVTPQAITGWQTSGRISKKSLSRLAAICGKPERYFMTGKDPGRDDEWEDVRGSAQAAALGDGMAPDEYAEAHRLKFRASSLRKKGLRPGRLEVYYGKGDSMEPRIRDGDAVLVDKSDTRIVDDRIYFIRHEQHYFVKRLQVHGDMVFIVSDNRDDPQWRKPLLVRPGDDFEVLGRVRWIGSWED